MISLHREMDWKSQDDSSLADEAPIPPPIDTADSLACVTIDGRDGGGGGHAQARGLSVMLSSVLKGFDSSAQGAIRSQDELSGSLDRLIRELDQLLENAPSPFIVQHAFRISSVKMRVSALNSLLKSIQWRVNNIVQMLSTGLSHENATA